MRQFRTQLAGAMPDHFVHRGHQVAGFDSVLLAARAISSGDAANSSIMPNPAASVMRVRTADKQETLRSVFRMDLVFVRQIVADRGDVKIAGFDRGLHRLRHGGFTPCFL